MSINRPILWLCYDQMETRLWWQKIQWWSRPGSQIFWNLVKISKFEWKCTKISFFARFFSLRTRSTFGLDPPLKSLMFIIIKVTYLHDFSSVSSYSFSLPSTEFYTWNFMSQKSKTGAIVAMFLQILYFQNIAGNIAILGHQFDPRPCRVFPVFGSNFCK